MSRKLTKTNLSISLFTLFANLVFCQNWPTQFVEKFFETH